jgi:hypothetical protein
LQNSGKSAKSIAQLKTRPKLLNPLNRRKAIFDQLPICGRVFIAFCGPQGHPTRLKNIAGRASSPLVARRDRPGSVEEHRRSSFIAFGGSQGQAGLSPGRQAESVPHVGHALEGLAKFR